jgi:transposase, IS5 family
LVTKRTRKREFLEEMSLVVPWAQLASLNEFHVSVSKACRTPFPVSTMLNIHFMQQWFRQSDPVIEEGLHHMALLREFAQLDAIATRLTYDSKILRFRHLLGAHLLAEYRKENIEIRQKVTLLKRLLEGGYYATSGTLA